MNVKEFKKNLFDENVSLSFDLGPLKVKNDEGKKFVMYWDNY
jgi:hypothetical protein